MTELNPLINENSVKNLKQIKTVFPSAKITFVSKEKNMKNKFY